MATGAAEQRAIEAVVLAAGSARRFGGGKLLAPWRGGVLLEGALAAAFAAPARSVTLVTGADAARVEAAAGAFAEQLGAAGRLRLVHAADYASGMAASLRAGIESLADDAAAAFVFLGDMPRVPPAVLGPMAEALDAGAAAVAPTWQGRRGNPVLLARRLFPDLLALTGDTGARPVLERLGPALARVEAPDDGVLFDVDERGDLEGEHKKPGSPLSRG